MENRKIESVFIGQHLDVTKITAELEKCLLTDKEIIAWKSGLFGNTDNWPISSYQENSF